MPRRVIYKKTDNKLSKCLLMILSCKKYNFKRINQRQNWINNLSNLKFYHLIGDIQKCQEKEYIFDDTENILYLNCPDDYLSLPKKTIKSIKALNERFELEYIFKTDDDHNLLDMNFFSNLYDILKQKESHYGGCLKTVSRDTISRYNIVQEEFPQGTVLKESTYCMGGFYLLSKEACLDLISKEKEISGEILEDYAIGYYLDEKYKKKLFHFNIWKFFKDVTIF